MDRTCEVCGAVLVKPQKDSAAQFARRRTCGGPCKFEAIRRAKQGVVPDKTCSACGKPLERRAGEPLHKFVRRSTCGDKQCLFERSQKPKNRRHEIAPKPCNVCGNPIPIESWMSPAHYKNRKVCGEACKGAVTSEVKRQLWEEVRPPDAYCLTCGVLLERRDGEGAGDYRKRKTCGDDCANALRSKLRRDHLQVRHCFACGIELVRRHWESTGRYRERKACGTACAAVLMRATKLKLTPRKSPYPVEWSDELKQRIRDRDGNACRLCGTTINDVDDLSVHHIDYRKQNCTDSNLITLCRSCHGKTHTNRSYWQRRLSAMNADVAIAA